MGRGTPLTFQEAKDGTAPRSRCTASDACVPLHAGARCRSTSPLKEGVRSMNCAAGKNRYRSRGSLRYGVLRPMMFNTGTGGHYSDELC